MSSTIHPLNVDELMSKIRLEVQRRKKEREAAARASFANTAVAPCYVWGTKLMTSANGTGVSFLREGWSTPEANFVWSAAPSASIELPVQPPPSDLILRLSAHALTSTQRHAQRIRLLVDGVLLAEWSIAGHADYSAIIFQRHLIGKNLLVLQFDFPEAFSPLEAGLGNDNRLLGIALYSFNLEVMPTA